MGVFLQIVLVNLAVSCDNVGVIAMATRGLSPKKALVARRIGVILSLVLKLVFVVILGYLFRLPWLHIRIIGGVLLLYITFHMLRQNAGGRTQKQPGSQEAAGESFFLAILTILAADASMSLDNVIAILSIVSEEGETPGRREILIILAGLLVCVPVLLWFSGTVSRWMESCPALTCLCAGYLGYMAASMIFEDEMMVHLFRRLGFEWATPAAISFGIVTALYGLARRQGDTPFARRRNGLLTMCLLLTAHSLVVIAVISYLETHPMVEGHILSAQQFYGFVPTGADAVFAISANAELPVLCAAIYTGILLEQGAPGERFGRRLYGAVYSTVLFILLEHVITAVGLTVVFGLGTFSLPRYLLALLLQTALLCTFPAVFCAIGAVVRGRPVRIILSLLYVLVESIGAEVSHYGGEWHRVSCFFPTYYTYNMSRMMGEPWFAVGALLVCALWIGAACLIGGGSLARQWRKGKNILVVGG